MRRPCALRYGRVFRQSERLGRRPVSSAMEPPQPAHSVKMERTSLRLARIPGSLFVEQPRWSANAARKSAQDQHDALAEASFVRARFLAVTEKRQNATCS